MNAGLRDCSACELEEPEVINYFKRGVALLSFAGALVLILLLVAFHA